MVHFLREKDCHTVNIRNKGRPDGLFPFKSNNCILYSNFSVLVPAGAYYKLRTYFLVRIATEIPPDDNGDMIGLYSSTIFCCLFDSEFNQIEVNK